MASKVVIIYSSVDGQTKKICEHLHQFLMQNAQEVELFSIQELHKNIDGFDKIIIASSIRYGKHNPEIEQLISSHIPLLNSKKTVFVSVNLVARKEEKNKVNTNPYVIKFLNNTAWKPSIVEVFAGRLDYSKYTLTDRILIKLIMLITKGPVTAKQPIEYTDWDKVDELGAKILKIDQTH